MRAFSLFALISLLLTCSFSCITIDVQIGKNDYQSLNAEEKPFFKPFDLNLLTQKVNNLDSLSIYELNAEQVKASSQKSKFLWVHFWRPYCKADYCTNIKYFADMMDELSGQDIAFMLVSEDYSLEMIKESLGNSPFDRPIYVIDSRSYAQKAKANKKQFFEEVNTNPAWGERRVSDDLIFNNSSLVHMGTIGTHMSRSTLDSLMQH